MTEPISFGKTKAENSRPMQEYQNTFRLVPPAQPALQALSVSQAESVDSLQPARRVSPTAQIASDQDLLRKLYLEITTECNMDCPMCVRRQWPGIGTRMSTETFERVLQQAFQMPGLQTIHFGGFGEPMVHPQFPVWLVQAAQTGLQVEFITNGLLLEESIAETCIRAPVARLFVSLDSAQTLEKTITHGDVFDMVRRNLRRLYAMKLACRAAQPEVYALFVASRSNLEQLWELKRLAPYLGLPGILVSNLIPYRPEQEAEILYQHWSTVPGGLPPSSWNPVVDLPRMDPRPEILELIQRLRSHGTPLRIAGTERYDGQMRCPFVVEGRAAVGPTGDVSPCLALLHSYTYWFREKARHIHRHTFGNIHEQSLGEIWSSPAYQAFRQRVRMFTFPPCIDCGGCDLRETNQLDCLGNSGPTCGACLWAAGLVQCP